MLDMNIDKFWQTVVNTIQDGIMIIEKGGTFVSVNRALEKITGYSKKDLIGKPCDILQCNICDKAREGRGKFWCVLFKTGKMTKRRCTFLRKDGTYVHALKNATLLRDANGKAMGAVESVTDITEIVAKENEIQLYRKELQSEDSFHGLIGRSAAMTTTFDLITNAAQSDAPVIILGESGTGKELVARAIHERSNRKLMPFIKVNCAALTETLLESELFGHVKGAYTGAYKSREGRFEMANGGDIFLDEIGDLPLSTQVKLLRVLEEKVVERVGDNRPINVDVRIISATNKNLDELVRKAAFREDLFFRINVIPIRIPPLRERIDDISLLAESFFQRLKLKSQKNVKGISSETMEALTRYHWPGNVRELNSAFEYVFVTCNEPMIRPYHLPANVVRGYSSFHSDNPTGGTMDRDNLKRAQLVHALEQAEGNQSEAARILGVSRVTVWNRMKKYDVKFRRNIHS